MKTVTSPMIDHLILTPNNCIPCNLINRMWHKNAKLASQSSLGCPLKMLASTHITHVCVHHNFIIAHAKFRNIHRSSNTAFYEDPYFVIFVWFEMKIFTFLWQFELGTFSFVSLFVFANWCTFKSFMQCTDEINHILMDASLSIPFQKRNHVLNSFQMHDSRLKRTKKQPANMNGCH